MTSKGGDECSTQGSGAEAEDGKGRDDPKHEGWEENEAELNESREEVGQLAGVKADDTSVKALEGETATGEEKGIAPASTSKAPNVLYQNGAETMVDVGQAMRKGRGQPRKEETAGTKISGRAGKGSVTDKETRVCVDPGGNEVTMNMGEGGGSSPPRGGGGKK